MNGSLISHDFPAINVLAQLIVARNFCLRAFSASTSGGQWKRSSAKTFAHQKRIFAFFSTVIHCLHERNSSPIHKFFILT